MRFIDHEKAGAGGGGQRSRRPLALQRNTLVGDDSCSISEKF